MSLPITSGAPKTLVIGASGFAGGYLVKELESANHHVFQANFPEINLLNRESIDEIVKKTQPDYIVNLAAVSSVSASWNDPIQTIEVNIRGTLHLLEAIHTFSPKSKVLLIGSAEEYAPKEGPLTENDPLEARNPYGISKIAQENFAELYRKKYGMNIICTRSFNHTGPGQTNSFVIPSFIEQVVKIEEKGEPGSIKVGNLNVYRDFSDVRDVVHAYRMLLENENEFNVYNVGSGKAALLKDILQFILSLSSVPITVEVDQEKFRPTENPYLCADISRIQNFWKGTDIRDTIRDIYLSLKG